jgi:hypothetical protein
MKHANSVSLHQYWSDLKRDRSAPERGDIDPAAVAPLLRDMFILDGDVRPRQWIFRLAGTRICALAHRELRNSVFADLWQTDDRDEIMRVLRAVADEAAPAAIGAHIHFFDGSTCEAEVLVLPLRHCGRTHARLLGLVTPLHGPSLPFGHPLRTLSLTSLRILDPPARHPRLRVVSPVMSGLSHVLAQTRHLKLLPGGRA